MTQVDARPVDCRLRLRDEGKPYPKSGCKACGASLATGLVCPHQPESSAASMTITEADRKVADELFMEEFCGTWGTPDHAVETIARHREQAVQEAVAERDARIAELEADRARLRQLLVPFARAALQEIDNDG